MVSCFTATYDIHTDCCNGLDGLVSRELGLASSVGEVYNELIDRVSDALIFLSVAYLPNTNNTLGFMTLLVILFSSYLGILSKSAGSERQYGGLTGKTDRIIYISIAGLSVAICNAPPPFLECILMVHPNRHHNNVYTTLRDYLKRIDYRSWGQVLISPTHSTQLFKIVDNISIIIWHAHEEYTSCYLYTK